MKLKWIYIVLLILLVACGEKPESDESNEADVPAESSIIIEDIEPEEIGGEWSRKIQVPAQDGETYQVSKYDYELEAWINIGDTSHDGVAVDEDITKATKYRVGDYYESQKQYPKYDLVLGNLKLKKPTEFVAPRVILTKDSVVYLEKFDLNIWAHTVIVDSAIKSFSWNEGGKNSGNLFIWAHKVLGGGKVYLYGQAGHQGAPGTNGRTGDAIKGINCQSGGPGHNGQNGGRGGSVTINYVDQLELEAINTVGGKAGLAGKGGEGGWFRVPGQVKGAINIQYLRNKYHLPRKCPNGPDGAKGKVGPIGVIEKEQNKSLAIEILEQTAKPNS